MAEPLKDQFGPDVVECIGADLASASPGFPTDTFVEQCLVGFDALELTPRGRQIAEVMARHLPADRGDALRIVMAAFGPADEELVGMEGFRYMPYAFFIAQHGLDHFGLAMEANYELTKRFTAEFSIRPYLERYPDATLDRLRRWVVDPSEHVRRLVSEGTRPRLPWAPRLRGFQDDPTPVIELLELLKDDPSEYVRRSVANNLNDIAKDHPAVVVALAENWWRDGDANRRRLVRHGLRTLIKQTDPGALAVLGYSAPSPLVLEDVVLDPSELMIGDKLRVSVTLANPTRSSVGALVDLRVHFVKANGSTSPKVFKGAEIRVEPGGCGVVRKTVSVAQHSTRTHHPGEHEVEVLLNGEVRTAGSFTLLASD